MKRFLAKASASSSASRRSSTQKQPTPPPGAVPGVHTTGLQPSLVLPPVPHPCPHAHIAVLPTKRGLLLRLHIPGGGATSHVQIAWGKTPHIEEIDGPGDDVDWSHSIVIYGIVGIMQLFSSSYLLVITSKADVGHLFDLSHAVFSVKGVTAIPLTEDRARTVLNMLKARYAKHARPSLLPSEPTLDSISSVQSKSEPASGRATPHVTFASEEHMHAFDTDPDASSSPTLSGASTPSSDEGVRPGPQFTKAIADRLAFWNRLPPKRAAPSDGGPGEETPFTEEPDSLDAVDTDIAKTEPAEDLHSILIKVDETAPAAQTVEEHHKELETKIVKQCVREFAKGGMYFSYTFDITRSLQHKQAMVKRLHKQNALLADLNAVDPNAADEPGDKIDVLAEPNPTFPLWRRVDRQFWWNEWLSKPFIDAGLHPYVLPIMQGYYQIASFSIPREPVEKEEGDHVLVDYIVVSRRSRDRAGLRYQRRGIDDEANVANFVETESIMKVDREGACNVFAYVQIRGSVPLFWTQSGYSLKPPPLLSTERTHEQNMNMMRRHFQKTVPRYGPHDIVNLTEHEGKEAALTKAYKSCAQEMDWEEARYHEYDFHKETKGMKYENISKLINEMERIFDSQGYFWVSNGAPMSEQKGVFRVNCIDCLDRTNVVQSAFARHIMNKQLGAVALIIPADAGRSEADNVFNNVWANNGDSISRAYAGTSALKGDYTRTGKRDLGGMLNDGVNSLARMYTATFTDWFCQANIDFMLGYRSLSVFSEFLLRLQSTDPGELVRLSKIRAEAIATCVSRLLADGERLLSGWTVFAPVEMSTKFSDKFEEKVLLLTVQALYVVSYDYNLEKVKIYTRVPLADILWISKGAYILSPLEEASRDPLQNAGFIISWTNAREVTRMTTYSVRNSLEVAPSAASKPSKGKSRGLRPLTLSQKGIAQAHPAPNNADALHGDTTFAAFKALPIDPARIRRGGSGSTFSEPADEFSGASSCKEAVDLMVDTVYRACKDAGGGQGDFVKEADVVSLAEAQRMTSMYAKMEYGVKRLLWLGG